MRAGLGTALESAATAYSPVGGIRYCVDPKTGELQTYSIAPGIYSAYDYTNALAFHGQTLPRRIAVMEGQRGCYKFSSIAFKIQVRWTRAC